MVNITLSLDVENDNPELLELIRLLRRVIKKEEPEEPKTEAPEEPKIEEPAK